VVLQNNDQIVKICPSHPVEPISEFCFLNTMLMKFHVLEKNLPKIVCHPETNEYNITDIVQHHDSLSRAYILNPYIANKECILIRKVDDKNFAEEVYMEHRNSMFIHQCYGLWKKCDIFENRLQYLENVVEKNNLV
jgi:hypothetical protein